ncbi:MAG TPA: hypothetical protein VFQ12_07375, partial [Thermoleophilaceae bacterium]|nr:hypothetical protein [Thermoleophilaceae bacterium]
LPSGAGVRPAALFAAGTLPLTGLSTWLLIAAGGWLVAAGLALLFTLSWFTAGRRLDARLPHPLSGRRFVR